MNTQPHHHSQFRVWCLVCAPCLLFVHITLSPSAKAQDAIAKYAFNRGVSLVKEQRWGEAIAAFQLSYSHAPKARVQYNIAMCFKVLDDYPRAILHLRQYLEEVRDAPVPDLRKQAAHEIAALSSWVGWLDITAEPTGATLKIDDSAPIDLPLVASYPVLPGQHTVTVSAARFKAFTTTLNADAGETVSLQAELVPASGALRVNCPEQDDATVSIDGTVVGACPYKGEISLGEHSIQVTRPGKNEYVTKITAIEHELVTLTMTPPSTPALAPSPAAPIVENQPLTKAALSLEVNDKRPSTRRLLAFSTMGVGLGGLTVGIVFTIKGVQHFNRSETIKSHADKISDEDAPEYQEFYDIKNNKLPRDKALIGIGYSLAGLGLGIGTALFFSDLKRERAIGRNVAARRITLTSSGLIIAF